MRALLLILIIFFSAVSASAQVWRDPDFHAPTYYAVDKPPVFPGGRAGYLKYLADSLQLPDSTNAAKVSKPFFVGIIIDSTGKVVFVEIGNQLDENYSNVILKAIRNMPAWKPGLEHGRPVSCAIRIPVLFIDEKTRIVNYINF